MPRVGYREWGESFFLAIWAVWIKVGRKPAMVLLFDGEENAWRSLAFVWPSIRQKVVLLGVDDDDGFEFEFESGESSSSSPRVPYMTFGM